MSHLWRGFLFLLIVAVSASLTAATGYQVSYGTDQDINEWSTCKNVANAHASGKAIFVPTKTSTEWSQFYTHAPAGVTIGACSCAVTAGSTNLSSGTYTIPCYNTLVVELWGGGGGGGNANASGTQKNGNPGGTSSWGGLTANGGGGGGGNTDQQCRGADGTGGAAGATGDTNSAGGNSPSQTAGGASPNGGGATGATAAGAAGSTGNAPGGGGQGAKTTAGRGGVQSCGGGGGGGAYTKKTYAAGALTVGATVNVTVGAGGTGGNVSLVGGNGAAGRVRVTVN